VSLGMSSGMSPRGQAGFTLIEVLVASVIMFTVLATATLSLRGAMHASERASRKTELLAPLSWITPSIRGRLRESVNTSPAGRPPSDYRGEGTLFGVDYRFHAVLVRFAAPPSRFDVDAADFTTYAPRFGLYDVDLELEREGEKSRFIYQELAWQPLVR